MKLHPPEKLQSLIDNPDSPLELERRQQISAHIISTPDDTRDALRKALAKMKEDESLSADEFDFAMSLFDVPTPATAPEEEPVAA